MRIGGVDGVPTGWVVCLVDGSRVTWSVVPDAGAVLEATAGCAAVGVDVPLSLPDGRDRRTAEVAARRELGRDRAAVFWTPPAEVLAAATHAEACEIAQRVTGRGVSLQTFHIASRIAGWQAVALPRDVHEVHPEVSFRRLAPGVAFANKKTARGAGQRIAALSGWCCPAAALGDLPSGARLDDVLDALVAAWTAERVARGDAEFLGPGRDARGRSTAIAV